VVVVGRMITRREMGKETTEILNTKIYPAIYERAQEIFTKFGFERKTGFYISTTNEKITGEKGKPKKVYYYENNPKHRCPNTLSLEHHIELTALDL
jgi:hypothetical protein